MGNAAHERHTFHILQRLLEAKNVSVIADYCPNPSVFAKDLVWRYVWQYCA
jgi:hypothetical protein